MLKKLIFGFISCLLFYTTAFADQPIKLVLNGTIINSEVPPQMIDGRIMVPLRVIGEALDAKVKWSPESWLFNEQTQKSSPVGRWHVNIKKGYKSITMFPNEKTASVEDNEVITCLDLDVSVKTIQGRVFVPLRFVSEIFGGQAVWDKENKAVQIKYSNDIGQEILKRWSPAVVTIQTENGQSTGFIPWGIDDWLSNDDNNVIEVITCTNNIIGTEEIKVITDSSTYKAAVYLGLSEDFFDEKLERMINTGLARLVMPLGKDEITVPSSCFGDSSLVEIGDKIFILEDLSEKPKKITEGRISDIKDVDMSESAIKLFITDTTVYPESSGAPVFNENGEIIGVLTDIHEEGKTTFIVIPIGNL